MGLFRSRGAPRMRFSRSRVVLVALPGLVAALALVLALDVRSRGGAGAPPSVDRARAALDGVIDSAGSAERLCEWASSKLLCAGLLQDAGAAPEEVPRLLCWGDYAPGGDSVPGLVMRVHGTGDDGQPYESDLLAIDVGQDVRFINPIYWTGTRISATGTSGAHVEIDCEARL